MKGRMILALLLLVSGPVAVKEMLGVTKVGVFPFLEYVPILITGLLTVAALVVEITSTKSSNWLVKWGTSLFGMSIMFLFMALQLHRNRIDSLPNTVVAVSLPGANFVSKFEFKQKGYFKLTTSDLLGQSIYYGRYRLDGDTLQIVSSNFKDSGIALPTKGYILKDTIEWIGFARMSIDTR